MLSEQVFRHVAHYYHLYQVLLSERGAALARNRLIAYLTQQAVHFVVNPLLAMVREPTVPVSFLATYVSGTFYSAITWWLDHQQQKTSEEMGLLVRTLIQPAMLSALGIDPQQLVLPEKLCHDDLEGRRALFSATDEQADPDENTGENRSPER